MKPPASWVPEEAKAGYLELRDNPSPVYTDAERDCWRRLVADDPMQKVYAALKPLNLTKDCWGTFFVSVWSGVVRAREKHLVKQRPAKQLKKIEKLASTLAVHLEELENSEHSKFVYDVPFEAWNYDDEFSEPVDPVKQIVIVDFIREIAIHVKEQLEEGKRSGRAASSIFYRTLREKLQVKCSSVMTQLSDEALASLMNVAFDRDIYSAWTVKKVRQRHEELFSSRKRLRALRSKSSSATHPLKPRLRQH